MSYDDDELPITSSELYLKDAQHEKQEYQERKAKEAGGLFRFLLTMLKYGINKQKVTAKTVYKKAKLEDRDNKLKQLREETEKVYGWATKTRMEQETMTGDALKQAHISTDAALAQDAKVQEEQEQGIERPQQADG
jgi:hypothetical protein